MNFFESAFSTCGLESIHVMMLHYDYGNNLEFIILETYTACSVSIMILPYLRDWFLNNLPNLYIHSCLKCSRQLCGLTGRFEDISTPMKHSFFSH